MKDTNSGLLLRLFIILFVLIAIARSCGSPREGEEVKAYTWNREKGELEELDVYEGDDFAGMLKYTFGDWFREASDEE